MKEAYKLNFFIGLAEPEYPPHHSFQNQLLEHNQRLQQKFNPFTIQNKSESVYSMSLLNILNH
ncbi:hypothetical protein HanXRQr2_Chr04g0149221 [Helianthus annuus]|uniref:Uncharacterized protein n=1 Tax=Helianthus annuus TaxID=4232 RepID=A0A9K3NR20_HELAN|nr:hypothetical protein HanXRQr2_Chr04g0149221 [Helianthus annuus]KAJ0929943.1 hypothetical protein HanPSC8_Chr04g0143641 [Helianthus annuus]